MKNLLYLPLMLLALASCKKEDARQIAQYSIEQFYANTRFSGGNFSPDETRLLINSDESGIFNLYEITIADGTRRQLTTSAIESFYATDYVPGFPGILYAADKGGNEISHIYLLEENGKTTDLTPGENEKA
jgi:Tol biopolymer transport system component